MSRVKDFPRNLTRVCTEAFSIGSYDGAFGEACCKGVDNGTCGGAGTQRAPSHGGPRSRLGLGFRV